MESVKVTTKSPQHRIADPAWHAQLCSGVGAFTTQVGEEEALVCKVDYIDTEWERPAASHADVLARTRFRMSLIMGGRKQVWEFTVGWTRPTGGPGDDGSLSLDEVQYQLGEGDKQKNIRGLEVYQVGDKTYADTLAGVFWSVVSTAIDREWSDTHRYDKLLGDSHLRSRVRRHQNISNQAEIALQA